MCEGLFPEPELQGIFYHPVSEQEQRGTGVLHDLDGWYIGNGGGCEADYAGGIEG